MAYIPITNSEIDPDSPLATSLTFRFRDNPIAIANGDAGAPRVSRRAITPGGAGLDGAFVNADAAPTSMGFYEYASIELTAAKTFPVVSIIRVAGDVTLAAVLSLTRVSTANRLQLPLLNTVIAENGVAVVSGGDITGGGGAGAGGSAGGSAAGPSAAGGIAGPSFAGTKRTWMAQKPMVGGIGAFTTEPWRAKGGGSLLLIIAGNLIATGGTFDVSGQTQGKPGTDQSPGGGGGGSITIICTGTITGGTYLANGGNGVSGSGEDGGGGGGGYIALIAAAFAGVQTIDVAGGAGPSSATDGGAGYVETETLTEAQINALLLR